MSETADLGDELLELITARILGHERSNQKAIGPSGLGTECTRKLGFRLLEIDPWNAPDAAWRPTVGTAVHTWLHDTLEEENKRELLAEHIYESDQSCPVEYCTVSSLFVEEHLPRWLTETTVACGTIGKETIFGTLDVYDRLTATVIDWKIPGPTALKDYRRAISKDKGPPEDYRVQSHVYGRGLSRKLDLPVMTVALMFLPMNGELRDAVWWSEPYDPQVGREAFERAREVKAELLAGEVAIGELKRVNDHCSHCDWFNPGAADEELEISCPGHPAMSAIGATPDAEGVLGL